MKEYYEKMVAELRESIYKEYEKQFDVLADYTNSIITQRNELLVQKQKLEKENKILRKCIERKEHSIDVMSKELRYYHHKEFVEELDQQYLNPYQE